MKIKSYLFKLLDIEKKVWKLKRMLLKSDKIFLQFPAYKMTIKRIIDTSHDPIRISTIYLAIEEIKRCKIRGSFAEVGVYKGETSRYVHAFAPTRTCYLFDTFEGFSDGRFKDTSIEEVKKNIGNLDNIIFKKGYFPQTAAGLENERFAFVLLDADKHEPTLSGLEFFYPRMSPGGYIMVHDYNNTESNREAFRAVNEFLKNKKERVVSIPDLNGTVVFRK